MLARIEERVRTARARQSPVNTGVTQQEFNNAEKRLLQNSIISANKEETSRLRRKRLENLHLEKAIAESNLYVVGHRRRSGASTIVKSTHPPPLANVVVCRLPLMVSWHEVPVVQGFPVTPP